MSALHEKAIIEAAKALCDHTPLFVNGFTGAKGHDEASRLRWRKQAIACAEAVVGAYVAAMPTDTPRPDTATVIYQVMWHAHDTWHEVDKDTYYGLGTHGKRMLTMREGWDVEGVPLPHTPQPDEHYGIMSTRDEARPRTKEPSILARLREFCKFFDSIKTLPKVVELYYAYKREGDGTGWGYVATRFGPDDIRDAVLGIERLTVAPALKLTPQQRALLSAMANGHEMVFSQDGDDAWLSPKHPFGFLDEQLVIGLRKLGYIGQAPDDGEDHPRFGLPTIITDAGRKALADDMAWISPKEDAK